MGFGTYLQRLLDKFDITVSELSRRTGISTNTLYAIIRRDSDTVNLENLYKIAEALNISFNELTGFSEKQIKIIDALNSLDYNKEKESALIEKYRAVDEKGKHTIETVAEMEYNRCKNKNSQSNPADTSIDEKEIIHTEKTPQ